MFGRLPAYLMLIEHPSERYPLVVGADFDDHWPGQVRYDLQAENDDVTTYQAVS